MSQPLTRTIGQDSEPIPGGSRLSSSPPDPSANDMLRGVNNRVNRAHVICQESETIAQETLGELAHQRESLGRTRDRITGASRDLDATNKNLKYMYLRVFTNKLLLSSIILMEMVIIGLQLYLKFRK